MRKPFRKIIKKDHLRAALAAFFLIFLLGEWGGHSIICIGSAGHDDQQRSVASTEYGHEDPCQTMVLCSDGQRKDQQTSTPGHDATQRNGLIDPMQNTRPLVGSDRESSITFSWADRLFRPPSPPFHPPKQA